MSITGEPDGEPMKVGVAIADITTGMLAATGTLAALLEARATGRGRHVAIVAARRAAGVARQPRLGGADRRRRAGALRQRAPLDLPLRDVPGARRLRQPRGRHRRPVPALLRRSPGSTTSAADPRYAHEPRPRGAPRGARAAPAGGVRHARRGRLAARRWPRRASPPGRCARSRRRWQAAPYALAEHDHATAGPSARSARRWPSTAPTTRPRPRRRCSASTRGGAGGARLRRRGGRRACWRARACRPASP